MCSNAFAALSSVWSPSQALLHAIVLGADLEPATMSRLLRIEPASVGEVLESAWATGFLLPDGRAIPLVADAVVRYMARSEPAPSGALMHFRHEQHADTLPLASACPRWDAGPTGGRRPGVGGRPAT